MNFYKGEGERGAFTLYVETAGGLYCEIHHPSGDISNMYRVGDQYPIERVTAQFDVEPVETDDISTLFGVKGQIIDTLEAADGSLSTDDVHDAIDAESPNTTYGSLKHLSWDDIIERESAREWSKT